MFVTPRNVLKEIKAAKNKPWWVTRLFQDVEDHLAITMHKGKPLLDTPMTSAAVEAVLEEAVDVVSKPASNDKLLAALRRDVLRLQ